MILAMASAAYGAAIGLRTAAYRAGLLRATRVSKPVISVGNLTAGGNGKTPFVILLASMLAQKKVAVLSRGYKGRAERTGEVIVVSRGDGPLVSFELAGDEPVLIAERTRARVVVARDRRLAARAAIETLGAEVLILDDGFQHLRLARDLDLVLVDAAQPFGNGRLIPGGRLREPPSALDRASLVISVGQGEAALGSVGVEVVPIDGAELRGRKVALLAAIARPERFEETVRSLGAQIVDRRFYEDHRVIDPAAIAAYRSAALQKGAELVVSTEKDAVRMTRETRALVSILKIEHRITRGAEVLDAALRSAGAL